mmetsp:Transcript_12055/g.19943  ORF Transcript_12055/g.19943 Transcript_12055/m.19943 type:complete len:206 (+) Transcript_12055:357-974(+)
MECCAALTSDAERVSSSPCIVVVAAVAVAVGGGGGGADARTASSSSSSSSSKGFSDAAAAARAALEAASSLARAAAAEAPAADWECTSTEKWWSGIFAALAALSCTLDRTTSGVSTTTFSTTGTKLFHASSDFLLNSTCKSTKLEIICFMSIAFWFLNSSNSVSRRSETFSKSLFALSAAFWAFATACSFTSTNASFPGTPSTFL